MQGISFKGIYTIPLTDKQNPTTENYQQCMAEVSRSVDPNSTQYADPKLKKLYIDISDSREKAFEECAKNYGIAFVKGKVSSPKSPAEEKLGFFNTMIMAGAKCDKKASRGIESNTLYGDDGKTVIYKYETIGGKLLSETSYIAGKPESKTEYSRKGFPKKTFLYTENSGKTLVINHDEAGDYKKIDIR